jgi:hypothetical protein
VFHVIVIFEQVPGEGGVPSSKAGDCHPGSLGDAHKAGEGAGAGVAGESPYMRVPRRSGRRAEKEVGLLRSSLLPTAPWARR